MPSMDIVSKFDIQEVDNAVNIVKKDIANRYDFRGSNTTITLNKNDNNIIIETSNDMQLTAVVDMLKTRALNRKLSLLIFDFKEAEKASGMTVRQKVELKEGISKDDAKKINNFIKEMKLKVQPQIQGEQLRVTGKKIDDLQNVMSSLKSAKLGISLQFVNLKK
tara:strand:+ start:204 stop:695 length:492 start_codon:yes stop_codon:yes gene_type:complete